MTHEDAGHYAAKRPDTELNKTIASELRQRAVENKISCAQAHGAAVKLKVSPSEVGAAIDLLEFRINKCQLGLFGYESKTNIPDIPENVNPEMESAIRSAVVDDRITCAAAWEIAKKFSVPKAAVTAVCETMKVKINTCQLGSFR